MIPEADIRWCKNLFNSLKNGGIWGVPHSGLLFKRIDRRLKLVAIMPYEKGMMITAKELFRYQKESFDGIKERFEAAGIEVEGEILE